MFTTVLFNSRSQFNIFYDNMMQKDETHLKTAVALYRVSVNLTFKNNAIAQHPSASLYKYLEMLLLLSVSFNILVVVFYFYFYWIDCLPSNDMSIVCLNCDIYNWIYFSLSLQAKVVFLVIDYIIVYININKTWRGLMNIVH